MPNNQISSTKVEAQHRTLLILWFAFLMTIVMYVFLTFVLRQPQGEVNNILTFVFSGLGVFAVVISFAVKRKFFTRAVDEQQPSMVTTGFVIAMALCEVAALLGLVSFMVANDRYFFVLMGIAFLGVLLHFPKRNDLEAASYKTAG